MIRFYIARAELIECILKEKKGLLYRINQYNHRKSIEKLLVILSRHYEDYYRSRDCAKYSFYRTIEKTLWKGQFLEIDLTLLKNLEESPIPEGLKRHYNETMYLIKRYIL